MPMAPTSMAPTSIMPLPSSKPKIGFSIDSIVGSNANKVCGNNNNNKGDDDHHLHSNLHSKVSAATTATTPLYFSPNSEGSERGPASPLSDDCYNNQSSDSHFGRLPYGSGKASSPTSDDINRALRINSCSPTELQNAIARFRNGGLYNHHHHNHHSHHSHHHQHRLQQQQINSADESPPPPSIQRDHSPSSASPSPPRLQPPNHHHHHHPNHNLGALNNNTNNSSHNNSNNLSSPTNSNNNNNNNNSSSSNNNHNNAADGKNSPASIGIRLPNQPAASLSPDNNRPSALGGRSPTPPAQPQNQMPAAKGPIVVPGIPAGLVRPFPVVAPQPPPGSGPGPGMPMPDVKSLPPYMNAGEMVQQHPNPHFLAAQFQMAAAIAHQHSAGGFPPQHPAHMPHNPNMLRESYPLYPWLYSKQARMFPNRFPGRTYN